MLTHPRELFYKSVYRLARNSRALVRPFLSPEFRHRINLALIRRANSNVGGEQVRHRSTELGVNLYGYVHAESGVGQSARANIQSLTAGGVPISVVDVRMDNVSRMKGHVDEALKINPDFRINLFHINADQLEIALRTLGLDVLEGCFNIGFWAWELPEFPDEWVSSSEFLDEIWTPSRFCQKAIQGKVNIPVRVVPHAVWLEHHAEGDRSEWDVSFEPFTFYTMFDCLSVPERKNVRGAISAFEAAFGVDRTDVQLLIKVSNLDSHNEFSDFLMEKAATNPSIKLMSRYLDRQHIFELLQLIDCFVSLHRSEGFGLGIAEAMLLAKPVISTNWSGNEDFCNPENSLPVDYDLITLDADHGPYKRGQTWADPSVSHAASLMQRVLDDREAATHVGRKAARDIGEMLSPEHIGQLLRNRLDEVHARLNAG